MKTEDGGRDAVELYTLSQDDVLGSSSLRGNPAPIERRRSECQDFLRHAHGIVCELLAHLDKHLGLAPGTLEALNPLDKPSATSVRMLLTRPDPTVDDRRVALGGHTDIGTITMLFNVIGGLQILPAGRENVHSNWRYIRPQPGCAVINIGDSLVVKTGEVLRSGLHRVIMPPGKQASFPRYSLAYLVRPDRSGSMRRLGSTHIIPPLPEGEKDESLSVDDWATNKARQIMNGELKAQTLGGRPLGVNATA
jgi:isopenicillin N synthase-like dioxygenase